MDTTFVLEIGGGTAARHVGHTWEVNVWFVFLAVLVLLMIAAALGGAARDVATTEFGDGHDPKKERPDPKARRAVPLREDLN